MSGSPRLSMSELQYACLVTTLFRARIEPLSVMCARVDHFPRLRSDLFTALDSEVDDGFEGV